MYDKPFETPFTGIIPGHPHAEGLVADYLFNQQGTAKKIFDCTQRGNNLSVVGATLEKGGLVCDANGEYASFDNSGQLVNSEEGTIIIEFKSFSAFNDGGTRSLFSSWGGGDNEGDFICYKSVYNVFRFGFVDSAGRHWISIPASYFGNWETGLQIACLWRRSKAIWNNDNIVVNVQGKHATPSGQTSETSWNSFTVDSPIRVGNDAELSDFHCNGIIKRLSIHNKVLPEGLIRDISENPYLKYM